jgi:chromosome partitioning protein
MQTQRVVAIVNEKGGTAKTSTTVNLSAALGELGKKVLLVDLDGQAASSRWMGVEEDNRLAEALCQGGGLEPIPEVAPGVSLAPASGKLDSVAHDLRPTQGGQLRKVLSEMKGFDYVFIDCPPSLGNRLIGNAFLAATHVIVPVETSILALDGLRILLTTLEDVREGFGHDISLGGVLACRYDARTKLSGLVLKELRRALPGKVYDTVIRENVRMRECPASGQSILQFAPDSNAAKDYAALAKEIVASPRRWDHEENASEDTESGRLRVDGLRAKAAEKVREFAGKASWRKNQGSRESSPQAPSESAPVPDATLPAETQPATQKPEPPATVPLSQTVEPEAVVSAHDSTLSAPVSDTPEASPLTEPAPVLLEAADVMDEPTPEEAPSSPSEAPEPTPPMGQSEPESDEARADTDLPETSEAPQGEQTIDIESLRTPAASLPTEWGQQAKPTDFVSPPDTTPDPVPVDQEVDEQEAPVDDRCEEESTPSPISTPQFGEPASAASDTDDMSAWRKRLEDAQRRLKSEDPIEDPAEDSEEPRGPSTEHSPVQQDPGQEAPEPVRVDSSTSGAEDEKLASEAEPAIVGEAEASPEPTSFRPDNTKNPFAPPVSPPQGLPLHNSGAAGLRKPAQFGGLPTPDADPSEAESLLDRFTTRRTRPAPGAAEPQDQTEPTKAPPSPVAVKGPALSEQLRLDRLGSKRAPEDTDDDGEKYPALRAHLRQMKQEGKLPDDGDDDTGVKEEDVKASGLRKLFRKMAGAD